MRKLLSMREALSRPDLFGDLLGGDSWASWRVLLIAIVGEALSDDERALFKSLTGREREPLNPVDEFWGVVGRRGGKTRSMAVLASFLAGCCDNRALLGPGERGVLPVLAATVDQARQAFNFIAGAFDHAPNLREIVEGRTADTLSLKAGVDICVRPASFRSIRGITAIGVVCDEIAFWRSDDSANPDREILTALRPSLATTGGPLIAIGSPYAKHGELWSAYRSHYGADGDPAILVAKAASREMNPSLSQAVIDRAMERDATSATAEYLAEFRTDVAAFIDREVVEGCVANGRRELRPMPGVRYHGFVDPSGGSSDSMTLAVAHADRDKRIVVDCLREIRPPFSPDAATAEFAETLRSYRLTRVTGDRFGGEWPRERFRVHGIAYDLSDKARSDLYLALLPLLNAGRLELLDNKRLVAQLAGLERRTARSGRDSVDHGPGGHDDVANAVAGAAVLASSSRPTMVISDELLRASAVPPGPARTAHYYRRQ